MRCISKQHRSDQRMRRRALTASVAVAALTFSSFASPVAGHEGDHSEPHDSSPRELPNPDPYGENSSAGLGVELPEELADCHIFGEYVTGAPSLRAVMGLPAEVDKEEAVVETSLGILVTADEAKHIDAALALAAEVDSEAFFGGEEDDGLMDGWWDYATGTLHIYTERPLSRDQQSLADAAEFHIEVHNVESATRQRDIQSLVTALDLKFDASAPQSGIEIDRDPTCGKIMILVSDASDVSAAERAREAAKLDASDVVIVRSNRVPTNESRWDHHMNDNDGGMIVNTNNVNSGNWGGWCTTSINFSRPGVNGEWLVTAGHCLNGTNQNGQRNIDCGFGLLTGNNAAWLNPLNDINNCTQYIDGGWGGVTSPADAALFAGFSWETGDAQTIVHGGVHGRVNMHFYENSIWDSPIGTVTCHSGGNWGSTICGTLSSRSTTICTETGCRLAGRVANTASTGGDSGGTVWADDVYNHYAGIHTAGNGTPAAPVGDTQWFTHVQRIRAAMTGEGVPVGLSTS